MKEATNRLYSILQIVPQKAMSFSNQEWAAKPLPHKWSKKEILGHLCDSALYNWKRFTRITNGALPYSIEAYPQDHLVKINAYQHQTLSQLLQLWQSLNWQIHHFGKMLNEEQELIEIILIDGRQSTLGWLYRDYVKHLKHHLRQIFPDWSLEKIPLPKDAKWQWSIHHSMKQLAQETEGKKFTSLYRRGKMYIEIYAPEKVDLQQPHTQDELYVVISGHGLFYNNGKRHPFQTGDVLFVPAGVEHRFEHFSEDFKTWVIFYGPEGGEKKHLEVSQTIDGNEYSISTDDNRLDVNIIHQYLTNSYWAKGRSLATVQQSLEYALNFGLYTDNQQIGLARVITDHATFAYLADVFILENYRGKNLGKWMLQTIMDWDKTKAGKSWLLKTKDAHGLYKQFGFKNLEEVEIFMEKR